MLRLASTLGLILLCAACSRNAAPGGSGKDEGPTAVAAATPAGDPGSGPSSAAPVQTRPPNVPEFEPAFPEQTRAPAVRTQTPLEVETIAGGFDYPWAIAFLPDRRMLVTEKHAGRLRIVTPDGKKSEPVQGVPRVDGRDQGGLLDVALGPDGLVYLSYYEPREGGNGLAVARARLVESPAPKLEGLKVIFRMQPTLESTKHAGGRLVFTPDKNLFVTLGERSILKGRVQARDLDSHLGKIVRINPDGTIPEGNPFVGRAGALPAIYSLGHRNILGADLDAQGRLWVAEMGPQGGDELNLIQPGADYGWPTIGYGEEYSGAPIHESPRAPGLEQPVYYWDPVISPGALTIYSGDLIPEWKENFLIAGLSARALVRLKLKDERVVGEEWLLTDRRERIREVVQGPDGALYLLTDGDDAELLRLAPKAG